MFPSIQELRWDVSQVVFVGAFASVLLAMTATVTVAAWRARRDRQRELVTAIRRHERFEGLPESRRRCRHELAGHCGERTCDNAFHCATCAWHRAFANTRAELRGAAEPDGDLSVCGLRIPGGWGFDRGHTRVEPAGDGTVRIGLDDFARRLLGRCDATGLPPAGSAVRAGEPAWEMRRGARSVRVLAPLDGTVVESGSAGGDWTLRVRPRQPIESQVHLLRGEEARAWLQSEVEALQQRLAGAAARTAMADGGELVQDVPAAHAAAEWDSIWGDFLLDE